MQHTHTRMPTNARGHRISLESSRVEYCNRIRALEPPRRAPSSFLRRRAPVWALEDTLQKEEQTIRRSTRSRRQRIVRQRVQCSPTVETLRNEMSPVSSLISLSNPPLNWSKMPACVFCLKKALFFAARLKSIKHEVCQCQGVALSVPLPASAVSVVSNQSSAPVRSREGL